MRILHLITHLSPGGIERWLLGMLPYLKRAGIEVDFLCRAGDKGSLAEKAESQGARFFTNPVSRNQLTFKRLLQERLRSGEYALVHNHLTLHSGLPALLCRQMGVPNIVSFHNAHFAPLELGNPLRRALNRLYARANLRLATRKADLLSFCSEDVQTGVRRWVDFGKTPTRVLHYGVEMSHSATEEEKKAFREALSLPPDAVLVAHVGRFSEQKNHAGIVKIAEQVCAYEPRVFFLLIGDGALRPAVEARVNALGLQQRVRFPGLRNDVEALLRCADIFLFPSLWEGLPVAALEAGAAGLPIVGSDVPGLRQAVVEEETGFLLALNNTQGFAEKVLELAGNVELRERLGQAGREWVEREFSYEASAKHLVELYKRLL